MNKTVYVFLIALVFFWGCSEQSEKESYDDLQAPAMEMPSPAEHRNKAFADRKVIKRADLHLRTEDLEETQKEIGNIIFELNGYVSNEETYFSRHRTEINLSVRIPEGDFHKALTRFSESGNQLTRKSISIEDVTERYVDTDARLQVKKEIEQKYLQLLERAQTVEEILKVQRELSEVREDVEAAEAIIRLLDNQIQYSFIDLLIVSQKDPGIKKENVLIKGFQDGWRNFISVIFWAIRYWPFILILSVLFCLVNFKRKRKR